MRHETGLAMAVACLAACGDAFTALPGDGGASDGASDAASFDAGDGSASDGTGESGGDGSTGEGGVVEGGRGDASACAPACPPGFVCAGTICVDNAADQFSASQNPSGNWSYGWSAMLASTFSRYLLHSTVQTSLDVWGITAGSLTPSVFFSSTGGTYSNTGGAFKVDAHQLGFWPGANNEHSIVRWTAPEARRYSIDATFTGLSAPGTPLTTVSVTILVNGSVETGQTINTNGGGNTVAYSKQHFALGLGDVVDFIVDWGNDGNANDDATGLKAVITAE